MAAPKEADNWIWQYLLKLNDCAVRCKIDNCYKNYTFNTTNRTQWILSIKGHLYHEHGKYDEENRLKWVNNNDLVWRYFDKIDLYEEKCKFCGILLHRAYIPPLRSHLRIKHKQEITDILRKEIVDKSLSENFEINEKLFIALCKYCHYKFDIFYGKDILVHHICPKKIQRLESPQKSKHNNVNRMTEQSIADGNTNSSSHHDNLNRQVLGNRENQQSNVYFKDIMASLEKADSWIWQHLLKLDDFLLCNINRCPKMYETNTKNLIPIIKGHLYHEHGKYHEEDRLKWIEDNDLLWRYFDKLDLYEEKCKFCGDLFHESHIPLLRDHLREKHKQEIRDTVRKGITDMFVSSNFEINVELLIASCKYCDDKIDIFYGTDCLIFHICLKEDQRLKSREAPKDNNVNRITQQSIADGNTNSSSHHDNLNRQVLGNRENQQSTGTDDLRSHSQYHINENSKFEETAAGNREYRIMQQNVEAENMATRHHHESTHWHDLENKENQQSSEGINVHDACMEQSLDHDVSGISSCHDNTNWPALGYQVDRQSSEGINMHGARMEQSLDHDVSGISSCHDSTNWQPLGYQVDRQRLVIHVPRYCVDTMATPEEPNSWIWNYFNNLNEFVKCQLCPTTYKIQSTKYEISYMKRHLYHEHKIYNDADRLKWESDDSLIWRYFERTDIYEEKCKFCGKLFHEIILNKHRLKKHLHKYHLQVIQDTLRTEIIANKTLSQNFIFHEGVTKVGCIHCKSDIDIFYGIDILRSHLTQCVYSINIYNNISKLAKSQEGNEGWEHENFIESNNYLKCTSCRQTYKGNLSKNYKRMIMYMKRHLYLKHNICSEEDCSKWKTNNDLIWRYFEKIDLYKEKCKFCGISLLISYVPDLRSHLNKYHRQEIIAAVRKEVTANNALSQHFQFEINSLISKCIYCKYHIDIFYGIDMLNSHLTDCHIYDRKRKHAKSQEDTKDNNVAKKMLHSVPKENNITVQISNLLDVKIVNTVIHVPRYCVDTMATPIELDNWMWEHFKISDQLIECKLCQTFYTTRITEYIISLMKSHLYRQHNIYREEDCSKWEADNDSIWRYFKKIDLYEEKCNFCGSKLFIPYVPHLRRHLNKYHRQEIIAAVRNEVTANNSLSQHFQIDINRLISKCIYCKHRIDIFCGIDILSSHLTDCCVYDRKRKDA
ncbi:hypothetical protein ALC57_11322 [Trachymyrmex cornetzi]|uniref:BED-type domain-containing protein n=1 Tax=Trachymyrmex cornetzi TaxID=471704 RepID=A0A195DUM3_9HYME|nr:hypothetical protein ALC57_11322 [Trachymyrmex cornetzi]